ncbi:MAG: ATP-binding cassette domain-containing protein [Chitinispirillaceae bacterium]|nr:ATP-binding cassette domain-containing protein [Chitinispirillaceae bacterium]
MITLDNVSKHYGSTDILNSVSVALHDNERTGLVGVNGSGKTTLLRMLSGQEEPDRGAIQKSSALTIGYLPQEVEVLGDKTAIEIVLEPFAHLLDFEEKLGKLADNSTAALQKIDDLHNELEFHDVYSLEARAKSILAGLGVPKDKWEEPVRLLSGGFRMRTVLGRLLLSSPDFLLLDEPTNHLDMDSLVWLEDFLKRYRGGMLIVSHDRDFLNRMCGFIAEIRVGSISLYKGNYNEYLRLREQAVALAESRTRHLQDQITQKERFVERFKAKNTKATQAQARMRIRLRSVILQCTTAACRCSKTSHSRFLAGTRSPSSARTVPVSQPCSNSWPACWRRLAVL